MRKYVSHRPDSPDDSFFVSYLPSPWHGDRFPSGVYLYDGVSPQQSDTVVYCLSNPLSDRCAVAIIECAIGGGVRTVGSASVRDPQEWFNKMLTKYFGVPIVKKSENNVPQYFTADMARKVMPESDGSLELDLQNMPDGFQGGVSNVSTDEDPCVRVCVEPKKYKNGQLWFANIQRQEDGAYLGTVEDDDAHEQLQIVATGAFTTLENAVRWANEQIHKRIFQSGLKREGGLVVPDGDWLAEDLYDSVRTVNDEGEHHIDFVSDTMRGCMDYDEEEKSTIISLWRKDVDMADPALWFTIFEVTPKKYIIKPSYLAKGASHKRMSESPFFEVSKKGAIAAVNKAIAAWLAPE
jgi:hypothetical protein